MYRQKHELLINLIPFPVHIPSNVSLNLITREKTKPRWLFVGRREPIKRLPKALPLNMFFSAAADFPPEPHESETQMRQDLVCGRLESDSLAVTSSQQHVVRRQVPRSNFLLARFARSTLRCSIQHLFFFFFLFFFFYYYCFCNGNILPRHKRADTRCIYSAQSRWRRDRKWGCRNKITHPASFQNKIHTCKLPKTY